MRLEQLRLEIKKGLLETSLGDSSACPHNIGQGDIYESESFILTMPKGIAWKCKKCSTCCKENDIKIGKWDNFDYFNDNDAFRDHDSSNLIKNKPGKTSNECIFLKNNRCSIYNMRPIVCKIYPFTIDISKSMTIKKIVLILMIQSSCSDKKKSICQGFYEGKMDNKILKKLEKYMKTVLTAEIASKTHEVDIK